MLDYLRKTYNDTAKSFHKLADNALIDGKKMFIVTANPEIFMVADKNSEFSRILLDEKVTIVPDGIGVVKGMQKINVPVKERIPGVELSEHLLKTAAENKKSVYFLGAKQEVIDALLKVCDEKYNGIKIAGAHNGYCNDFDAVFDDIIKSAPDLVLVALGVPKQELLIAKHIDKFEKGIFIGVGGTFDVLSGTKQRAPKFFIKCNLEWLYRLLKEPKRIKRFWDSNVKFFSVVGKEYKGEK